MKLATTAKLPGRTSAKVADPANPAWTEDMLGEPVLKRGRGPQAFFKSQGSGYQSRINDALRMQIEGNLTGRPSPATRKRVSA